MKKTYINPELEVVKMKMNQHLLDGSPQLGGEYDHEHDGDPIGREFDFDSDF